MIKFDKLNNKIEKSDFHAKLIERIQNVFVKDRAKAEDLLKQRFDGTGLDTPNKNRGTKIRGVSFLSNESEVLFDVSFDMNERWTLTTDQMKDYFEKNKVSIVEQLLDILDEADQRYREILKLVPNAPEDDRKKVYRLRMSSGEAMSTPFGGGDMFDIGDKELVALMEALESGDENKYKDVRTRIASQFFHEQLHYISGDSMLDTKVVEEFTMIGEVLYDPKSNHTRNQDVFGAYGSRVFQEDTFKAKSKWTVYDKGWKGVGLPILIKELVDSGKIKIEEIKNNKVLFREIAESLPSYFSDMPQNKRMAIVAKYATKNVDDLYKEGELIIKDLGLIYS